ncbi:organic cation/carnitine transporter 7 isoform X1 [Canna indica]|uniref:Organic cation/carnitine transporter 7 isoform X1 n=1 Tax=Canna indica TaxID=4628 RepID=A0AAQ3QKT2_9LILI|nr:organic cation/carnitine transporter 7 isoform X1 [Canna indica]
MIGDGIFSFTVDEALLSIGFGKFQALVLCYAGMGWISEAMEMMLLSFVGPAVQSEWNLSSQQESLITSVVFAGMLLGAYSWGIVSDIHGRRQLTHFAYFRTGFLFTALVTSGAGFLSSFAPNYLSLLLLRFMVGVGLGGGPVLASWFLEFIPAPDRGKWMVIFSAFWTIGTIFEASLAWVIMPRFGWRWLLAFSSLPSFLLLLFYAITPESPRYLCMRGQMTDAMQILERMARINHKPLPSGSLISDNQIELDEKLDHSEAAHLVENGKSGSSDEDMDMKVGVISSLRTLLSQKLIRATLLLWMVFFGNAFSYYGIVLLTSELSNGNRVCAAKTTETSHTNNDNLYKDVFVTSFAEVPGLILSAAIVDRIGRKLSMSSMLFISCVFLVPLIFPLTEELTTILLFFARISISASFTIIYIYAPEIYPTSVRTSGIGIASSVGRIGGITCPLVAVGLVHGCHQSVAVLLFELVIFLSGIAVASPCLAELSVIAYSPPPVLHSGAFLHSGWCLTALSTLVWPSPVDLLHTSSTIAYSGAWHSLTLERASGSGTLRWLAFLLDDNAFVCDFEIDADDRFSARLDAACTALFKNQVRYNASIIGTISPGQIVDLSGIAAQDLFL